MSTRLSRKERNLCSSCNNPPRAGKTQCQSCARKARARVQARRAAGLCQQTGCKNKALPGGSRCQECRDRHAAYERKYRKGRSKCDNICNQCGGEHGEDTRLCAACKEKALLVAYRKNFGGLRDIVIKRDNGLCSICSSGDNVVVHHVSGDSSKNTERNLLCLCRRCHADIHRLGGKATRNIAAVLVTHASGEQTHERDHAKMSGWIPTRRAILERDGNSCVLCNEGGGRLFIHHKDDCGLFALTPNNNHDNLVTLCAPCRGAITNQRSNGDRERAAILILALGPGTVGTPV